MNRFSRFIVSVVLVVCSVAVANAQKEADQLFLKGQELASVMTKASQQQAIVKFKAAKIKYLIAEKKKMCDNQIAICYKTINKLSKPAVAKSKDTSDTVSTTPKQPEQKKRENRKSVKLSLSETRLDFKSNPKDGATQSVDVECNYDSWKADTDQDWITIYTAEKKFSVEVAENDTDKERSGVIKVSCGAKTVDLVVNQAKPTQLRKITDSVGGLFKKKKKK